MANAVTKAIGNAFLYLGSRLAVPGIRSGDLTAMLLGEETDPRSRRHQVIRIMSSAGHQVCWEYNCRDCGVTTRVDVVDRDHKVPCVSCKRTFSIKEVIHEMIRDAQKEAILRRGAQIDLSKPITQEDFSLAVNSLPVHIPSQVTSPAERRRLQLRDQLGEVSGDTEYSGSTPGITDMSADMGFNDHMSAVWHRTAPQTAEQRADKKYDRKVADYVKRFY